jgi:hypothetical protein
MRFRPIQQVCALASSRSKQKRCCVRRAVVVALCAFVGSVSNTCLGQTPGGVQGYTVQGLLEEKLIRYSSTERSYYYDALTTSFEIFVADCRWLVKLGTDNPAVYDYRVVSSDGENAYLLLNYETRLRTKGLHGVNNGDGTVTKGNVPCFGIAEEAGAVWITYGSGCRLAEQSRSDLRQVVPFVTYVKPTPILPGQPLALERANWVFSDQFPHLPVALTFFVEDASSAGFSISSRPNARRPFTNIVYQAVSLRQQNLWVNSPGSGSFPNV